MPCKFASFPHLFPSGPSPSLSFFSFKQGLLCPTLATSLLAEDDFDILIITNTHDYTQLLRCKDGPQHFMHAREKLC